jgi:outer membrane immunogenic protein
MTKLSASVSTVALAAFFASPALSADLGKTSDPTSSEYVAPAFQGLGIGINGGGQFTNIDVYDQFDGIGADGLVGGAHAEYLFALGQFRVGPYIDGGFSNVNTDIGGVDLLNQDWYFGGGVKAGIIVYGSTLIYGKVGYEISKWSILDDEADADVDSAVLGGGVETMIARNVSLGLEANYVVPMNIEVEDQDITDYLDASESLRVLGRLTWRQ